MIDVMSSGVQKYETVSPPLAQSNTSERGDITRTDCKLVSEFPLFAESHCFT